jgi:hypothetical protein
MEGLPEKAVAIILPMRAMMSRVQRNFDTVSKSLSYDGTELPISPQRLSSQG